jgi:hypothetical protein
MSTTDDAPMARARVAQALAAAEMEARFKHRSRNWPREPLPKTSQMPRSTTKCFTTVPAFDATTLVYPEAFLRHASSQAAPKPASE